MLIIALKRCPYCKGTEIYSSRPQTRGEEMADWFLLRPVRCHGCMLRHLRPVFMPSQQKSAKPTVQENPTWQISSIK
jgi:hypothetical protein